jgi:hypothetical protein
LAYRYRKRAGKYQESHCNRMAQHHKIKFPIHYKKFEVNKAA